MLDVGCGPGAFLRYLRGRGHHGRLADPGNAPDLLREAFPVVQETIFSGALVFTEPGPIVDYVMTRSVAQQAADDPELFGRIHAWATVQATRRLEALGGTWRHPKSVGLYRCVAG